MFTLITFATQWGSKYGGINNFNTDFLTAFGVAYHLGAQVVCVVASATPEAQGDASKAHVRLVPLQFLPAAVVFGPDHGEAGAEQLKRLNISFNPDKTVWLGHDRITGAAAIAAAKMAGGRSAVIHHMSYDHYESYAEDSQSAERKTREQTTLFQSADLVLAVGPLLRDAVDDRLSGSKPVRMLIPGLADIEAQEAPKTFVAFMSGRLSDDAARIKQGHLGVAAFAKAQREARDDGMPEALCKQPKLLLRGVDFEGRLAGSSSSEREDPEGELKHFAEDYAGGVVNIHALPYTEDRRVLYSELSKSSVALMPSWHEGFGLVAWEAIAAGVPLILSKSSGVYRLLEEEYPGAGTGCVYPLDVRGASDAPFFHEEDLRATVAWLKGIANNPGTARKRASILRNLLGEKTWAACAEQAAQSFGWELNKGSMPAGPPDVVRQTASGDAPAPATLGREQGPLQMPVGHWRAGAGMADSQLLRAEEALLSFDPARQPEIDKLDAWLDDRQWPQAVRLITGAGGQGKTRLALELCQKRLGLGWHAGFLDTDLEPNKMGGVWQDLRKHNKPLLIVLDYAETRQTALLALLKAALQNSGEQPLRMLLLARDAGEWWDNLPSKDRQCEALLSGHATSGPFRLPPLYEAEPDRRAAYSKALNAFARALGVNATDIVPDLIGEHFERPLYVQMAALLALYGERTTTAQGLTKALLNHERRYWGGLLAQFIWREPERRAEQLLALTTLAGGFATPRAAEPYWSQAKGDVLGPADFSTLFRALATLYPGTQGLQALRPDLLGEALVAQALLRPGADTLLDAVLSNSAAHTIRSNALTVLARLSPQRPDLNEMLVESFVRHFVHSFKEIVAVGKETPSTITTLAEEAFARLPPGIKSQVAGVLAPLFQDESVQLSGLSCIVSEYLADKTREKFEKKPNNPDRMAEYARRLVDYGIDLVRIGRPQQALDASQRGLKLFNKLAVKDPRRFEPEYARALFNQAYNLRELGQNKEALDNAGKSLEIYSRLAQKNPNRFEPKYALALSIYANCLGDAGNDEEALENDRKFLEISQRLAQKNPDRFEPDYAQALNNHAISLGNAGNEEEAIDNASESLEIYRRLAQKNPDRFEPDYAMALNNYADRLSEVGREEEAVTYIRQSIGIRQELANRNPDRFDSEYAGTLASYAEMLCALGQYEEARDALRKPLEIRQRLALKTPKRFASTAFGSTCFMNFLAWLLDEKMSEAEAELEQMLAFIPSHRRPLLLLYSAFVEACRATDRTARQSAFERALSAWENLSTAGKIESEAYWLCAAAWSANFGQGELDEGAWTGRWRRFVEKRSGRLPRWMLDVARRMEFSWPEST
jgi:glycosyltransferase involved in cell wall biosynthesis